MPVAMVLQIVCCRYTQLQRCQQTVTFPYCKKVTDVTKRTSSCFSQEMPRRDNPYLVHLPPSQRGTGVPVDPTAKEPLYGFLPRKVTGPQVLKAMVCFYFLVRTWI